MHFLTGSCEWGPEGSIENTLLYQQVALHQKLGEYLPVYCYEHFANGSENYLSAWLLEDSDRWKLKENVVYGGSIGLA